MAVSAKKIRVVVGACVAVSLAAMASATWAVDGFNISKYQELKLKDRPTLEMILEAMRESAFYAQQAIGRPVLCITPAPVPGEELIAMVEEELINPSNPGYSEYHGTDPMAFVLVNALKKQGVCS